MKKSRTIWGTLRYNRLTLIWFEIIYKLVGVTVLVPLLYASIDLSFRLTGLRYLTPENLKRYFRNPSVYLILAALLMIIVLYSAVDMSAVIYICHNSHNSRKASFSDILRYSFKNLSAMFRRGNRGFFGIIFMMTLFFCIAYIPELVASYDAENLLQLFVQYKYKMAFALILLMVLLFFPFTQWIFSFHAYSLKNMSRKEAVKESRELIKDKKLYSMLHLIFVQVLCVAAYIVFLAVGIFLIIVLGKIFAGHYLLSAFSMSVIQVAITVLLVVFSMIGVPTSTVTVSFLYYRFSREQGREELSIEEVEDIKHSSLTEEQKKRKEEHQKVIRLVEWMVLVLTISFSVYNIYRLHKGEMNVNIEYLKTMEVTAHRGASWYYPENTMAAFQGALEAGADWLELDVHLSSDGQVFIMHDRSFKRTTGVDKKAWELTYSEIEQLDAGSYFSSEFAGEKIPLLSEVIEFAKANDIRLNIEMKPSKYEEGLEEKVVDLLKEMEYTEHCVVTSQTYSALENIKRLDESVMTVYVTSIAYGNIHALSAADAFSVKASSVSDLLVTRVHNAGKQIYAWTVNNSDAINLMIERQVDNIITDNVPLAKKCIATKMSSSAVNNYINFLNRQLRLKAFVFRR